MWSVDDRLKQLAWQAEHDSRHHKCGLTATERRDWYGPDGKELHDPPFEVDSTYCPACALVDEEEKDAELKPGESLVIRRIAD
jgi:hypothetical protein